MSMLTGRSFGLHPVARSRRVRFGLFSNSLLGMEADSTAVRVIESPGPADTPGEPQDVGVLELGVEEPSLQDESPAPLLDDS